MPLNNLSNDDEEETDLRGLDEIDVESLTPEELELYRSELADEFRDAVIGNLLNKEGGLWEY